ncbi:MAG: DUF6261 family protein [Tannerellaceae bacterium]|jgi:hypothetical protein|nr:DUF6261 family protein [Tannerellaceae bacterium]
MHKITYKSAFLAHLRNAEHYDLFRNIVHNVEIIGVKPAALLLIWNLFRQAFDKEDRIYKRAARREETAQINEAHEKRKTAYMALKRLIESASYSATPSVKTAADLLLWMMENYSSAYYVAMNESSALFDNLVQDFAKEQHAEKVALIPGAGAAIARLEQDNEDFMTLYAGRALVEEEEKEEGSMFEARKDVEQKFDVAVEAINTFYRINELQVPKDAEVSEALSKIILFINAYLRQHEATYARRNPKYHAGGGDQPSPPDGEPSEPGDATPQLVVASQETLGESQQMPGYGTQMSLRAADAAAFAAALYPAAKNGILRLGYSDTEDVEDFPIPDFLFDTDGTTPIGLLVDAPNLNTFFIKPFQGIDVAEAEVLKDGELLAILLDVQYPATMSEG